MLRARETTGSSGPAMNVTGIFVAFITLFAACQTTNFVAVTAFNTPNNTVFFTATSGFIRKGCNEFVVDIFVLFTHFVSGDTTFFDRCNPGIAAHIFVIFIINRS
jgi:hypothetical protein